MDISQLNSFSDVSSLNEHQLRIVLSRGDEPAQIWAAWALGIKLSNESFLTEIGGKLKEEPLPGVRQHLMVFLAGSGNHDLLEKYARADPNIDVRIAACNLLGRVAENVQERNLLLEEIMLTDSSDAVHIAILTAAARDSRIVSLDTLRQVVIQQEQELQERVFNVISAAVNHYDSNSGLVSELQSWAIYINHDVYERYCEILYEIAGDECVLQLARMRQDLSAVALSVLVKNGFRADWSKLIFLAREKDVSVAALLLELLNDDSSQSAVIWLLQIVETSIANENRYDPNWFDVRHGAIGRIHSMIGSIDEPTQTVHALSVLDFVRSELDNVKHVDPDDTWDVSDNTSLIKYYEDLIQKMKRWV